MQKNNKKDQARPASSSDGASEKRRATKFEFLAKMKLAQALEYDQAFIRLTNKLQFQTFVTSISFLIPMIYRDRVANHSNFLNVHPAYRSDGPFF